MMGRSTTADLIARGKNQNSYNNSGIETTGQWVDGFNSALQDLVSDINLTDNLSINFVTTQNEYPLPADFFELLELSDGFSWAVPKRRTYNYNYYNYNWFQGYYILNRGSNYVIDLQNYNSNQTFNGIYIRYPVRLTVAGSQTEQPEVPTVGEDALIYYAISKALRNNNQTGMAIEMERKYEVERRKIRDAAARTLVGGW